MICDSSSTIEHCGYGVLDLNRFYWPKQHHALETGWTFQIKRTSVPAGETKPSQRSMSITSYTYPCTTTCSKGDGTTYNWCRKSNGGWDYCSVREGYGSYGKKCQKNTSGSYVFGQTCSFHYRKYMWCYTTDNSWDYCSPVDWPAYRKTLNPNYGKSNW